MNAPSSFQRMGESNVKKFDYQQVLIEDVLIDFKDVNEHMNRPTAVRETRASCLIVRLKC